MMSFADIDEPQRPAAALLVIDRDQIVYKKCYGLADLEAQRPITTDTSFYLGSISKPFTAMAIMLLAQDGRLSYEDRVTGFFRQFPHGTRKFPYAICCITHRACRNTFHSSARARPCGAARRPLDRLRVASAGRGKASYWRTAFRLALDEIAALAGTRDQAGACA